VVVVDAGEELPADPDGLLELEQLAARNTIVDPTAIARNDQPHPENTARTLQPGAPQRPGQPVRR
jgi:hypothetical protein